MFPAISIVIPAFNEGARLGETIRAICVYLAEHAAGSEIIVVSDGSRDQTAAVAREVFGECGGTPARLIEHYPNRGKGAAVRAGLLAAANEIALFTDADLSTPIEELPKIVAPVARGDADLVFGSRALDRSLIGVHQPWRREQGGRVFNLLVRAATGLPFWDTQCGFKSFRMAACRPIIEAAKIDGFGFDVELLLLAHRAGVRLREVAVRWNHFDGSKLDFFQESFRMLRELIQIRQQVNAGSYDGALGLSLQAKTSRS
ncbi:MAG: dolichyl-phosphate beta-glucosyltransferase [Verrucomicrobiota bacterium]